MRRRSLLLGGAAAGTAVLGGCGFHPLYLPPAGGAGAAEGLGAIYVPVIGERVGQLLRQALQRRVEGSGSGIAKIYELVAAPGLNGEPVAIQRDNSTTRIRLTATATWSLRTLNLEHTVLTAGTAKAVGGYNILDQQYFAADLESATVTQRLMESLADSIVQDVAIFLRRRAAATPPPA